MWLFVHRTIYSVEKEPYKPDYGNKSWIYIPLSVLCSHTNDTKIHIIFEMATFLRKNPQPLQEIFKRLRKLVYLKIY